MAIISHIDGPNRDIYLHSDTVSMPTLHPVEHIYPAYRELRRLNQAVRKYAPMLLARGNEPMGGDTYTERYLVLLAGTRIVPYDASHQLVINGKIITDDGQSGRACFDRSPLSATTLVEIDYIPPQVEVIRVSTGSGLSTEEHDQLMSRPDAAANAVAVWGYER